MTRGICCLFLGLAAACTGVPTQEELELGDSEVAQLGYEVRPTADEIREAQPFEESDDEEIDADAPRIIVSGFKVEEGYDADWAEGTARCPFTIDAVGLPAIATDGTQIADLRSGSGAVSEGEDEWVSFDVSGVDATASGTSTTLVHGSYNRKKYDCWRWYKEAKQDAEEINEMLAQGWRPMKKMPVEADPKLGPYGDDGEEDERPANTRPVQLTVQHGEVIFRVPGVQVLARSEDNWDRPVDDKPDEGMCWYHGPEPQSVYADPQTEIGLIEVHYESGPCMCDSPTSYEIVRLDAATITEIERRGALQPKEDW